MVSQNEALEAAKAYFDGLMSKSDALDAVNEYWRDSIPGVSIKKVIAKSPKGVSWVTVTATFQDGRTSEYQAEEAYIHRTYTSINEWIVQCVKTDAKYIPIVSDITPTPKAKYQTPTGILLPVIGIIILIIFMFRRLLK